MPLSTIKLTILMKCLGFFSSDLSDFQGSGVTVSSSQSRGWWWLSMTRNDFMGCMTSGPVTDSNHISSNHSPSVQCVKFVINLGHSPE